MGRVGKNKWRKVGKKMAWVDKKKLRVCQAGSSWSKFPLPSPYTNHILLEPSLSEAIDRGVPQSSVLSPTLFLLFSNDLNLTLCPIHSYADDSTLHYATSFTRRPSLQELNTSRRGDTERITSDLSVISDWGRANFVKLNTSKTQFLHILTRHSLGN